MTLSTNHIPEIQVTVITPVYNTPAGFLWELRDSLYQQSYTQFKWLIVDDGSTNADTMQAIRETAASLPGTEIITLPSNRGLPAARNAGVAQARTAFLFFIDSDDLLQPLAIEKYLITLIHHPNLAFVNSWVEGFGAQQYGWKGGFHDGDRFLTENRNTSCFLARREVFENISFDEEMVNGCEDWDFWLQAAAAGYWGFTIPEFLFRYRRHNQPERWASLQNETQLRNTANILRNKYSGRINFEKLLHPTHHAESGFEPAPPFPVPEGHPSAGKNMLFVIPWMEMGGADQYNLNLVTGLQQRGWTVTIACTLSSEQKWQEAFSQVCDHIFILPHYASDNRFPDIFHWLVASRNIGLIFLSNSMYGYLVLPYLRERFSGIPIVDYLHCEEENWNGGGYPLVSARYRRMLNRTYVSSQHLKEWCIQKGHHSHQIEVAYINIDTRLVKRSEENRVKRRKSWGAGDQTMVIAFTGRLTEQKQPRVLLGTLQNLAEKNLDFHAVIIGDGPDRHLVMEAHRHKPLAQKVTFMGALSNSETLDCLDGADLFFLPSAYEGIALSIYEAMSKELAIVGARVGGQAELVTPECGWLAERKHSREEVLAYSALLEQAIARPALIRQMGRSARERVVRLFDLRQMIDQMENSFQEVMLSKNSPAISIGPEYLMLMNRVQELEKENEHLRQHFDHRIVQLMMKYRRRYRQMKSIYHRIKKGIGSNA